MVYDDVPRKNSSMKQKLFTKSAFKIALECPRRLFYAYDSNLYANQQLEDDFLKSLAEGGFQVGELAKVYYGVKGDTDIDVLEYDESVEKTKELFKNENINIAEAAFRSGDLFIRADIIEKKGNDITLIEVKAKLWDPDSEFIKKNKTIPTGIRPYIYDVAFQKYVIMKALKELYPDQQFTVKARLMMADKSKRATVDGLNQMFRIYNNGNRSYAMADELAWSVAGVVPEKERVLTAFDVDEYCDMIIAGETGEQGKKDCMEGMRFEQFVDVMSKHYCERTIAMTTLGTKCFKCPFHKTEKDDDTLLDGYKECWKEMAKFTDKDFDKPLVKDLSGRKAPQLKISLVKKNKYFMDEITYDDLKRSNDPDAPKELGLDNYERKWLQIAMATGKEDLIKDFETDIKDGVYVDTDGLRKEMAKWRFPLHFIDFETSRSALPFYKGLRPYEQIAFQFSHHKVEISDDGEYKVSHQTQYINTKKGFFPNFEFVRQLKKAVGGDEGTIFRYMDHENTVLNDIRRQLESSEEEDKDELIAFIESITNDAARTMIDIANSVLKYYYHPSMKGSNSIKDVLPAILNSSDLIKSKYSRPVYGTPEMPSLNLENKVWIEYEEDGKTVKNPYKLLPSVSTYLDIPQEELDKMEMDEETVANGGAALAAYGKLQFSDTQMSKALEKALLCYCELDTLAMVFIWEYFYDMCRHKMQPH